MHGCRASGSRTHWQRTGLVAGGTRRATRRIAPDHQRDRDRQVRSEPSARVRHREIVPQVDRSDLRSGRMTWGEERQAMNGQLRRYMAAVGWPTVAYLVSALAAALLTKHM